MKHDLYKNIINRKIIFMLIMSLLCSGLVTSVYLLLNPIQYESGTTLYISNRDLRQNSEVSYQDLLASRSLAANYGEIVKSGLFAENIIRELNLQQITPKALAKKINASLANNANILHVTVRNENRLLSEEIARTVPALLSQIPPAVPDAKLITVLDMPSEAKPAAGGVVLAALISFFSVLLLSLSVLLLIRPGNNIIRTPEDVERTLGIKVTGTIPDFSF